MKYFFVISFLILVSANKKLLAQKSWESKWVQVNKNGSLKYTAEKDGDIIPDFSGVGFRKNRETLPVVPVELTIEPSGEDDGKHIQRAIDSIAAMPIHPSGFRGAILLKKGLYRIAGSIRIHSSGIVLRGEGDETKLLATGKGQRNLVMLTGQGNIKELAGTRQRIKDARVPVGTKWLKIENASMYKVGDSIIVYRPATEKWISDIKMDQIERRDSNTLQWDIKDYGLYYERVVREVSGDRIRIDNPVVMAMEEKYGGGEIYKYTFQGRIRNVGLENLQCISEYQSATDEDHAWNAVFVNRAEDGWIKGVTARHFGYSCVNLGYQSRNITVVDCSYLEAKSQITGGRRYSFNNDGQLNLVMNCYARGGRHDFVTGARNSGPNVFFDCKADSAFADIGPHHRWSTGTLYDNVITDGEINVQDRGNWGTGHGWAGVTQVLWNCKVKKAALQQPWTSGKNYAIGLQGLLYEGRLSGRPSAQTDGVNKEGLEPHSLYLAQLKDAIENEKNEK